MTKEMVNHPDHYMNASGVECIDVVKHMMFSSGNAMKYIYRLGNKDEAKQEIKKAIFYLNVASQENEYNDYRNITKEAMKVLFDKIIAVQPEKIGKAMLSIYYEEWDMASEYLKDYLEILSEL